MKINFNENLPQFNFYYRMYIHIKFQKIINSVIYNYMCKRHFRIPDNFLNV